MSFLDKTGLARLWANIVALADTKTPSSRKINGKALTNDVTLSASDVGAYTTGQIDEKLDVINEEVDGSIKGLSVSGKTITYTKNDGTTGTITTQDTNTDTKVTNTLNTTAKAYVTGTTSATTNTGTQVFDTGVYLDTTAGQLVATTFKGALDGNAKTATSATSATSATKATQDGNGNVITSTYETKNEATAKLADAQRYADNAVAEVKNDLLNGAGGAYDTLKELGDLIDENVDAIQALEAVAAGKADKSHTHTKSQITDFPTSLKNPNALTFTGAATGTYDGSSAKTVNIPTYTNASLGQGYGTCTTAASTVAKVVSLSNYVLFPGGVVTVKFTYVVPPNSTMNINSKGAYPICYNGAPIVPNIIKAGDTATFIFDGTNYHVIAVDRWGKDVATLNNSLQDKASSSHTHAIADVTDLQTTLDGKAASSHTHGNITNAGAIGTTANKAVITTTNGVLTTGTVPVASGGTGATTAAEALTNLGLTATAAELNIMDGVTATAAEINKLDGLTATTTELNYIDGVTSAIQTQLDGKASSTHTHNYAGSSSAGGAATSANKVNNALTFTGAVADTYDGSSAKTVNIVGKAGTGTNAEMFNGATEASGDYSHAEGRSTTASGGSSHAEGHNTTASGDFGSHAEGYRAKASGDYSHAEGDSTIASGGGSHAEGYNTTASGNYSHAEGHQTQASSNYQHVQGKNNIVDNQGIYAHIVGNGDSTPSNAHTLDWDGNAWFEGDIYLGGTGQTDTSAVKLTSKDITKLSYTNIAYGTCSTAAATAAKVITVSGNTNWALTAGSRITVKFSYTNTASNPTFNVNGTGAKSVWYNTAVIATSNLSYAGYANRPMDFVYDGTQFVFTGWSIDSNTTYSNASLGQGYGTCSTAAATAAKVVSLSSYALSNGGVVSVKFTYAVPASATMNINGKGAKKIFYKGSAITAGIIGAGDIATFIYDGTQYHLIAIDRACQSTQVQICTWEASD